VSRTGVSAAEQAIAIAVTMFELSDSQFGAFRQELFQTDHLIVIGIGTLDDASGRLTWSALMVATHLVTGALRGITSSAAIGPLGKSLASHDAACDENR
jgi:hypothetical protein